MDISHVNVILFTLRRKVRHYLHWLARNSEMPNSVPNLFYQLWSELDDKCLSMDSSWLKPLRKVCLLLHVFSELIAAQCHYFKNYSVEFHPDQSRNMAGVGTNSCTSVTESILKKLTRVWQVFVRNSYPEFYGNLARFSRWYYITAGQTRSSPEGFFFC